MKKILMHLLLTLPFFVSAQQSTYQVNGTFSKADQLVKAFLVYRNGNNQQIDTTAVVNGKFSFSGSLEDPIQARLAFLRKGESEPNNKDMAKLMLEKGTITITGTDSASTAKISSPLNGELAQLDDMMKPSNDQMQALMKEYRSATPEQQKDQVFTDKIESRYNDIKDKQTVLMKQFFNDHKSSYMGLITLAELAGPSPDLSEIEPMFESLSPAVRNTRLGKEFEDNIAKLKTLAIGALAPDFTQNDVNGKPVKLSDFKGKYVLVDFWASWCGPCRHENPNVVVAYNKYKDKNFTVLGVSLDNKKENWTEAIAADKLEWTQVSDLKGWKNDVAAQYSIQSIPQNFLLDPSGKIIGKNLRGEDLETKLAEVLK